MTTILVVDDSAADRRLVAGILEKGGDWTILEARDGIDALDQIELMAPDIVVTDLVMPRLNGRELVELIGRDFPQIPVILMTSQGSEQIAVRAMQVGASSYVSKKLLPKELCDMVARLLSETREDRVHVKLMHRLADYRSTFVLENDPDLISLFVAYADNIVRTIGALKSGERREFSAALKEALSNAIFHGNLEMGDQLETRTSQSLRDVALEKAGQPPFDSRRVNIELKCSQSRILAKVTDDGDGFDVNQHPLPDDIADIDRTKAKGILLMHINLDELRFDERGNAVTLVKRKLGR